jgi:hypothetical protein
LVKSRFRSRPTVSMTICRDSVSRPDNFVISPYSSVLIT